MPEDRLLSIRPIKKILFPFVDREVQAVLCDQYEASAIKPDGLHLAVTGHFDNLWATLLTNRGYGLAKGQLCRSFGSH